MTVRPMLLSLVALAILLPNLTAQPLPDPFPRIHYDLGYHYSWVQAIYFRDNDTELVTVGRDRTIRIWSLKPQKAGTSRCRTVFHLALNPSAVAMHPSGRYLALGFNLTAARLPEVATKTQLAILDLNQGVRGAVQLVDNRCLDNLEGIFSLGFSPDGTRLAIGGADGRYGVAELKPEGEPKIIGCAFGSLPGKHREILKILFGPENDLCLTTYSHQFHLLEGKDRTVRTISLPDVGCRIFTAEWSKTGDLAIGFATQEKGNIPRANTAVFRPENKRIPNQTKEIVTLDRGFPNQLAWTKDGSLLAALGGDDRGNYDAVLVKKADTKSVSQLHRDNWKLQESLSACAAGELHADTLACAASDGEIFVAVQGTAIRLEPEARNDVIPDRLEWNAQTRELLLKTTHGRETKLHSPGLWKLVGLDKANPPSKTSVTHRTIVDLEPQEPIYCSAMIDEKQIVVGTSGSLMLPNPTPKSLPYWADSSVSPGYTSLLAFPQEKLVISLGLDGVITFWEYIPAAGKKFPALLRKATATVLNGKLYYFTPEADSTPKGDKRLEVYKFAANDLTVYRSDFDPDRVGFIREFRINLPRGAEFPVGFKHEITVDLLEPGTISAGLNGRLLNVENGATSAKIAMEYLPADVGQSELKLEFRYKSDGRSRIDSRVISVINPGKLILLDITPQKEGFRTDRPIDTKDEKLPPENRHTAEELKTLFETVGRRPVVRRSASTRTEVHKIFTEFSDPKSFTENDTLVILLKGHAEFELGRLEFRTDDYQSDVVGSGITPEFLKKRLEALGGKPSQMLVFLDCCNAEEFLDPLRQLGISFYPCSRRGQPADALVFPRALAAINQQKSCKGCMTQADLLQIIHRECGDALERRKRETGKPALTWGNPRSVGSFIVGWTH